MLDYVSTLLFPELKENEHDFFFIFFSTALCEKATSHFQLELH